MQAFVVVALCTLALASANCSNGNPPVTDLQGNYRPCQFHFGGLASCPGTQQCEIVAGKNVCCGINNRVALPNTVDAQRRICAQKPKRCGACQGENTIDPAAIAAKTLATDAQTAVTTAKAALAATAIGTAQYTTALAVARTAETAYLAAVSTFHGLLQNQQCVWHDASGECMYCPGGICNTVTCVGPACLSPSPKEMCPTVVSGSCDRRCGLVGWGRSGTGFNPFSLFGNSNTNPSNRCSCDRGCTVDCCVDFKQKCLVP